MNTTSPEEPDIALDAIKGVVCALGIFGNSLVLFVNLVLKEYKKTVTHWFILQMAVADILCLFTIPFLIAEDLIGQWSFPKWLCKVKETIFFINYFASVMLLTTMSIDRYCAVCHIFSTRIQRLRTKRIAILTVVIIWVVAIAMSSPFMLFSVVSGTQPQCKCRHDFTLLNKRSLCEQQNVTEEECDMALSEGICVIEFDDYSPDNDSYDDEYYYGYSDDYSGNFTAYAQEEPLPGSYAKYSAEWTWYLCWCFTTMFVIPFGLITFSYSSIVMKMRKSGPRTENLYRRNSSSQSRSSRRSDDKSTCLTTSNNAARNRNKVTRMCFILVLVFLLCWCPFYVVRISKIIGISGTEEFCNTLTSITSVLAYSNSAINPYIYSFIGTSFWERTRKAAFSVKSSFKLTSFSTTSEAIGVKYTVPQKNECIGRSNSGIAATKVDRGNREGGELNFISKKPIDVSFSQSA